MRHEVASFRPCRRHTALLPLLLMLAAGSPLGAQLSVGLGGTGQHLSSDWWTHDMLGPSGDLGVRVSRRWDLTTRLQHVGYQGGDEEPIGFTTLDVGAQYHLTSSTSRRLQGMLGFGLGLWARDEYDAGGAGWTAYGHLRLNAWVWSEVGVFAETLVRGFSDEQGGGSLGLTLGLALRTGS